MCFSATASFVASAAIGGVGAASLKKARKPSEIAVAMTPVAFAAQQALEGIVWVTVQSSSPSVVASMLYLFFAYAFWPAFIPWAVRWDEPEANRKHALVPLMAGGFAVGLYGLYSLFANQSYAAVVKHSLQYDAPASHLLYSSAYVLVVCASCLASSSKWIKTMGFFLMVTLAIAYFTSYDTVASVWCFYAAILSVMVYFHLKARHP